MITKDKTIAFAGPVKTRSGYGARSRDICTALINAGYNLRIVPVGWGTTPTDALNADIPAHKAILDCITYEALTDKPDVFIHCTIPVEFQAAGKFNIGLTAGIETDNCKPEWIEGCNRMDLVLTSSNHAKTVFTEIQYQKRDKKTGQTIGNLKLTAPCEVLFEGVDITTYKKTPIKDLDQGITEHLNSIPETHCYLFVGHWLQGELGHDRKDVGMMLHTFLNTFKDSKKSNRPAIILKTGMAGFSVVERDTITQKIQQVQDLIKQSGHNIELPSVYYINGDLTDEEMNSLYNHPKVKTMISFTKGEGFGRPLLEFTTTGKPIIAPNWSGQVDFLNPEYCTLLPGQIANVHPSAVNQWIIAESKWFTVNYTFAAHALHNMYKGYNDALERAACQREHTLSTFTIDHMQAKLEDFIDNTDKYLIASGKPIEKTLKLPSRRKVKK